MKRSASIDTARPSKRKARPMRSSQDARDLIEAAIRQTRKDKYHPNYRAAAQLLGLKSYAALYKMRKGTLRDTDQMKAIISARKKLARKKFLSMGTRRNKECEEKLTAAREWITQWVEVGYAMLEGLK